MKTSDRLVSLSREYGWQHQGLTANKGKVHADYFSRDHRTIEVTFDGLGRIVRARRRTGWLVDGCVGTADRDKFNRVLGWLRSDQNTVQQ